MSEKINMNKKNKELRSLFFDMNIHWMDTEDSYCTYKIGLTYEDGKEELIELTQEELHMLSFKLNELKRLLKKHQ